MNIRTFIIALSITFLNAYAMERPMEKKPSELTNIGNACFINAVLQSLFSMNKLTELVQMYRPMYKPESFATAYIGLAEQNMKNAINQQDLENFCFQGWELIKATPLTQQDAGELLQKALEHLSYTDIADEISSSFDKDEANQPVSEISNLCSVKLSSQIALPSLGYLGPKNYESSLALSLPIGNNVSLASCLKDFFSPELVSYTIDGTTFPDAQKLLKIEELEQYVVINLKRTSYQEGKLIKNNDPLLFPIKKLSFENYFSDPEKGKQNYKLRAVILHQGEKGESGHYIAYVRYDRDGIYNWYRCSDTDVTKAKEETIVRIALSGYDQTRTTVPTTFIYEKAR